MDAFSSEEKKYTRRPRYSGKNPRQFHQKYKEHNADPETIAKVMAAGKTPAGMHRPIMLDEIMDILQPRPGQNLVDCTLGFGGHSSALLQKLGPKGHLLCLDADPIELPKTEERLRTLIPNTPEMLHVVHSNYAGALKYVKEYSPEGVHGILADLGLSSMQIDNPDRGFSYKSDGPLDMRMNPNRGLSARDLIKKSSPDKIAKWLRENADEPRAAELSQLIAGKDFRTTAALRACIEKSVPSWAQEDTPPRVFQAIRIAVNDEFSALDALLRSLPDMLRPGGRVAILTFHSGEDRRVKHAFRQGLESGIWSAISEEVLRPSGKEVFDNPRASCAKLRWAEKM